MRFHRAFVVAVVVVALAVGLASAHGSASAQGPATDTVTTPLQPGWNLVGWMGSDTTAADLFAAIPTLRVVAAWDDEAGRYQWVRRGGTVPAALARGQGLFLWVGGTRSVQWTRPASVEGMLLTLPSGYSLVGWAGLDGTPIAEAVGRFGDALVGASRWNAETQSYERYEPGSREPEEGMMPVLQHGDALWVELSEERRWWQSGTERTRFVFEAPVTQERKSELRDEMERVVAFFAERYGIEPPAFVVRVDPEGRDTYASRGLIHLGPDRVDDRSSGFVLAHEYFHVLQFRLSNQHPSTNGSPVWLTEGAAMYAAAVSHGGLWGERGDRARTSWWSSSSDVAAPLSDLEDEQSFYAVDLPGYFLGGVATDWLVRRAASLSDNAHFAPLEPGGPEPREEYAAHIEYYRLLPTSDSWEEAFEGAFGIAVDDFYTAFAAHSSEIAPPLPHLADEVDAPILVFEGDIPADTADQIRAQFEIVQTLFVERLGSGPANHTVFVVPDWPDAAAVHLRVSGLEREPHCGSWGLDVSVHILSCQPSLVAGFAWQRFSDVTFRLAPTESLPPAPEGYSRRGAAWLTRGLLRYVEAVSREAVGMETLSEARSRRIASARRTGQPLREMETSAGVDAAGSQAANALSFLAADWLAEQAGEPALFEYYRLLPTSDSWEEAFEGAFGITIDEFYTAFEDYRAAGFTS